MTNILYEVPRFPGAQPILIPGSGHDTTPGDEGEVVFEDKYSIDTFEQETDPPVVIVLTTSAPPAVKALGFDVSNSIIGGERDIILTVENGRSGTPFSAGAGGGQFVLATPSTGSGFVVVQYDGRDSSENLDTTTGLRGLDLTENNAQGFRIGAFSDINTEFTVNIYDSNNQVASAFAQVEGQAGLLNYFIEFALFDNEVDFTSINAITFLVEAFDNVDFVLDEFVAYGGLTRDLPSNCFQGVVLPCDTDYYRVLKFDQVAVGDYLSIEYRAIGENDFPDSGGRMFLIASPFEDLQVELASNENIVDTLGALPGPTNYDYTCDGNCDIEILYSSLQNETYYFAVEGSGPGNLVYEVCINYLNVPVTQLFDQVPQPVFRDQRVTQPPTTHAPHYHYYVIDIPEVRYVEGGYLVVNISRAEPFPGLWMGLMHESLPIKGADTGIIGESPDLNSEGATLDDLVYPFCVDMSHRDEDFPDYDHPVREDERMPCQCTTEVQIFGEGPAFQLTCELVVDPCAFAYGNWYIAVELPERSFPADPADTTGRANYTIGAFFEFPTVTELERNVTLKSFVFPEAMTHFKIEVPATTTVPGATHFLVQLSNVRNGFVDIWVHQGLNPLQNLAGGPEACVPANATCHTCDACNVVIEKCHFVPGTWYISVSIGRADDDFQIFDVDRLPITYTLRANWLEDSAPVRLTAGVPVATYIGEALYDFYVIEVPPTIDTWLFVELYAKAEDTEVIVALLHGALPGGDCYHRPDFYCMTGDPYDKRWSTGPPTFYDNEPVQRESCSFMIQTCELEAGPLFLSVYGHHRGYTAYGDTTFYQVPVHYTLWVDFDVALSLTSGVSYSETVFEKQYQHYYIRSDRVLQGSWLSVEITNIQHGIPQTLEAFINYNYLAGNCPCYDNLYNCTSHSSCRSNQLEDPTALPDVDSVLNCCTIVVPASDFRPGVWYIAVLGVNEDLFQYTTPIGYTLTATVHDAPVFNPLILGQIYNGEVPQWNITNEYANFRLGASPVPGNDLVLKVTFVQNCEFMGKHDDSQDSVWMYVNKGAPATHYQGGWQYKCQADVFTQSYCTIVIPDCEWEGDDYFVAIKGDYDADFTGRFTLRATSDEVRDYQLTDSVPHYARVSEGRYKHFFIDTTAEESEYLAIDIYTNQDQDAISAYMNKDARAGDAPCHTHISSCETETMCSFQLLACEMEPGRYYFSVYGHPGQFYDTSVEFTITASHKQVANRLFNGDPFTGHIWMAGEVQHYYFEIDEAQKIGSYITFEVDNVKHGAVTAYVQYEFLAGRCPCFIYEYTCSAASGGDSDLEDWCEIRVPSCDLKVGKYFFSIWAVENLTPEQSIFMTPIGYTLEVNVIVPLIVRPNFVLNRIASNTEIFQFVGDERYIHYSFPWTAEDFDAGYHVIVEITSVRDGALFVYYTPGEPGDATPSCHTAQICTNGLAAGGECLWQLPYCLTRPLNDTTLQHFISVEGKTGRVQASFNILMYKQNVPTVLENQFFTLDNSTSSVDFPIGTELNITHSKVHEPNGWTQFIRLLDVPAHNTEGRGAMLELFFYRVTNNFGEPLDFNVYVHPKRPAGAHGCCAENDVVLGACQEAPCSNTADTTASVNNGVDVFTHTCDFDGEGVGNNANANPFFGQRCTVRVWPCEFNKYCNEELLDWFVSVVPIEGTSPTSNGAGLSYSLQWRVRDIQLTDAEAVGSLSLNEFVNTYEYTPTYSVPWFTTESEGWRSFYVDYGNQTYTRLSIQTQFVSGSGVVYINGDEFASDTDSCHEYECGPTGACDSTGRFYVSECQSHYYSRYYITLRNTGDIDTDLQVRFRIVSIALPSPIEMTSHASDDVPFNSTSGPSIYPGVTGVEGDNYDSYYVIIDDDDLDNHNNWIVDVSRPTTGSDTGDLQVYIRFGNTSPGQYGVDNAQSYYDPLVEGCHAWQYTCDLPPQGRCVWQIPHCQTVEGYWQVAIGNPDFQFDGIPTDLPDYTIRTYISDPPIALSLGEQYVHNVTVNETIPLLQHFYINITAEALEFDDRDSITGFWTRYLRFQLDGIPTGQSVNLYVNYDELAGPDTPHYCYKNFASSTCGTSSCKIDITPCQVGEGSLVSGIYYIAVEYSNSATTGTFVPTPFALLARIYRNEYAPIVLTETIEGTGHRAGTNNLLYRYTVTEDERLVNGDGDGNYRYVINEPALTDDLDDHEYIIFNFTALASADTTDSLSIEVWRDDCTRYQCALSGPNSWCTIDALGLSPATAKLGRFFIRVENPDALPFTIDYYHNQTTIQTILDRQTITEIIYPYEYQEYYYEASDVGQGATLTVNICSICGDVQAFIRPDLPAGPYDANHPEINAAVDSCDARGPNDNTFVEENNCCTLFLDTCEYQQRGYYIGIRGVTQTFPPENQHIYLPAKYQIEPFQTTVNITEIQFSQCVHTISYTAPWTTVPSQFAFDLETINVGTSIRVKIIIPTSIYSSISTPASISVTPNVTNGYSNNCQSAFTCSTGDDNTCNIVISYDDLSKYDSARYYIWADAPRGTEILVERFEPYIPTILPNIAYVGTVGDEENLNTQFYRFELDPKQDENYWEKFFLRVLISEASQGSVKVILSTGSPLLSAMDDRAIDLLSTDSDSYFDVTLETLVEKFGSIDSIPKVFWLSVVGLDQTCELHSIKYTITVQTSWVITYFPIGETICNSITDGQNNFHRLQPQAVEDPQQSILKFTITDISASASLTLSIKDQYLATRDSDNTWEINLSDDSDSASRDLEVEWFCGYEQLYFSVLGDFGESNYRMSVHKEKIHVKEVFDDSIYYADDDDDDACPHEHDFYIFRTAAPLGHHEGSFFRVLVDSLFPTKVYVNKNTVAWGPCHDSGYGENDPSETGTTSVNVYDFCDFNDGVYYITVVSDGPYYIYTDIRDDAKNLTLGEVFRDGLEPGEYQMYTLEICQDWFEADDRLVVEITDVQGGDVYGWISRDANPGVATTEDLWPDVLPCYDDSALAKYGAGESGYDFLLVNHCELLPGTYHILIRTSPHEGTPSRNIEKVVTYRLFPYLIDYNIETVELLPNTIISDVVDMYTINRFDPLSVKYANYYHLMPLMEGDGYFEQISHAVARLTNVQGGLLNMKVMCGHLAISQNAYIDGELYGLTKEYLIDPEWRMQSSRLPFTLQTVIDDRTSTYQAECDGCSDFCVSMNLDDLDIYTRDSSAALWIPSCYFIWSTFYIAVEPINQYYIDHSITYDLEVHHTKDYILLQPNTHHVDSFSLGNWDYDFYYSISPEPQSMRWRVVVTSGEGVLVTVRNHRCPLQATWIKEVWCDAAYFDRPWMCDIEIPTRAAHPGDNAYFVAVYGKNATYSIAFWRGRENCHAFTGSGRDDGLNFCAGLVPYATWRWDNYDNLDKEAHCFYEDLYNHFKCQPCWNGVSRECNATLQAFACYESFRKCDKNGFSVGTCKDSCEAVVYECANWFETVNLEHYNCSSARYIDSAAGECAGNENFSSFNSENQLFLDADPQLILFKSSPPAASSSSSASSLTISAVLSVIALILTIVL